MTQMKVGVRTARFISNRRPLGPLCLLQIAPLLKDMPILYKNRWVSRVPVESPTIMPGSQFPLARIAGAISQRNVTGPVAVQPESYSRQAPSHVKWYRRPEVGSPVSNRRLVRHVVDVLTRHRIARAGDEHPAQFRKMSF